MSTEGGKKKRGGGGGSMEEGCEKTDIYKMKRGEFFGIAIIRHNNHN